MIRTRVGYTGGIKENPTYRSLGDHSESIQIDYDPGVISYEDLLEVFWSSHNPHYRSWSRQYMSAIFHSNEDQRQAALRSLRRLEAETGEQVYTELLLLETFYLAEDYHQKYTLRGRRDLAREYTAIFPDLEDFVNSTAVARVNGYLGGNGKQVQLEAEIEYLGLSPEGQAYLLDLVAPILEKGGVACPVPTFAGE